jgi:hypothetical protein
MREGYALPVLAITGTTSNCAASGMPSSRHAIATDAASWPPALSPATATGAPRAYAFVTARQSSNAAGNGCSGARR